MGALDNKTCLVTGAGRGIGRSIAIAFAREGARVAVSARSVAELDDVVETIRSFGGDATAVVADLADPEAPNNLIRQVRECYGAVQVLVNNAGIGSSADPKPVVDFNDDFWNLTLQINLTAPYRLCKAVLPEMLRARDGRILFIASINGKIGSLHGAAYAASKHGVLGLMRTLAMETARSGVTVNAICPGPVHTAMNDKRLQYDAARLGKSFDDIASSLTPIGRRLEPDEIAPPTVYLASAAAAAVTGQAFNIDGGIVMTG